MRRSLINAQIREAIDFCHQHHFFLPKWSTWSPAEWKEAGPEADEIRELSLGWDVTDFGTGQFERFGLVLFTLRNGPPLAERDPEIKDYCEKMLIVQENQITPMHFHWNKIEDLINRSGGRLVFEMAPADRESEKLLPDKGVEVSIDGIKRSLSPGEKLVLEPGESLTLPPYVYHSFYAEPGGGAVLGGEVSRVNDDAKDNRFIHLQPRYPKIEEDEPAEFLLCFEYPAAKQNR